MESREMREELEVLSLGQWEQATVLKKSLCLEGKTRAKMRVKVSHPGHLAVPGTIWGGFVLCQLSWAGTPFLRIPLHSSRLAWPITVHENETWKQKWSCSFFFCFLLLGRLIQGTWCYCSSLPLMLIGWPLLLASSRAIATSVPTGCLPSATPAPGQVHT